MNTALQRHIRVPAEELRACALSAVRSEIRRRGDSPVDFDHDEAWAVLDDISRKSPDTLAAIFYSRCGVYQQDMFGRDWRRWRNNEMK